METPFKTDADLIAELGGPAKVADLLGYSVQRVQNWISRGIPVRVKYDNPHLFGKNQDKAAA